MSMAEMIFKSASNSIAQTGSTINQSSQTMTNTMQGAAQLALKKEQLGMQKQKLEQDKKGAKFAAIEGTLKIIAHGQKFKSEADQRRFLKGALPTAVQAYQTGDVFTPEMQEMLINSGDARKAQALMLAKINSGEYTYEQALGKLNMVGLADEVDLMVLNEADQKFKAEANKSDRSRDRIRMQSAKPPPNFQWTDASMRAVEPIPGGPADIDVKATEAKASKARAQQNVAAGTVVEDLGRALELANKSPRAFGPTGGLVGGKIPLMETATKNAQAHIDSAVSNIGFDQLNQMRANSPTGGALGNVTELQLKMLQSVLGNLDTQQPVHIFRDNVKRAQNIYNNIVHGPGNGPKRNQLSFDSQGKTLTPGQRKAEQEEINAMFGPQQKTEAAEAASIPDPKKVEAAKQMILSDPDLVEMLNSGDDMLNYLKDAIPGRPDAFYQAIIKQVQIKQKGQ